jgi:glucan biosynthesis protein
MEVNGLLHTLALFNINLKSSRTHRIGGPVLDMIWKRRIIMLPARNQNPVTLLTELSWFLKTQQSYKLSEAWTYQYSKISVMGLSEH